MFQAALCEIQRPEDRIKDREIPHELSALTMRSLARDPKQRIATATEFVATLQDLVSGASKRRESLAVTEVVTTKLGGMSGDYRECGELLVLLGNARVLWPDNPAIGELRRRVLAAYAESALQHGDLLLARVQGERLEAGSFRDGLMARIAKAEIEKRRQTEELDHANQRLRGHHARAEELLNFMLNDLTEKLQTIGRLDILDTVVDQALGYFNALPVREMTNDMLARRARGLRLVGETHMDRGDVDGAETAFREAFTICEGLVSVFPANHDFSLELAECYAAVGRVVRARGDLERAGAAFNQVDGILLPMFRAHPSDVRLKEAVALNSNALADVLAVSGDIDGALERNRRFRELAGELVARDPAKSILQKHLAEGHGNYGWLLKAQGRAEEALDQYRIALDITQRVCAAHPSNMRAMGDLAFMHNKLGWVLEGTGDLKGAIAEFQASLTIMKQLVRRDPSNMRWRRLLSVSHSRAGRAMEAGGDLSGARREFEASVEILEPMAAGDQKDAWNREWLSRALVGLGRVCATAGDADSARGLWARAVGVTKLNVRNYKTAELRHLSTHAQALLHLERLDEARPMVLFLREKGFRDEDFDAAAKAHGFE
jgi:tetratricopeptide (TPR) repeat protein